MHRNRKDVKDPSLINNTFKIQPVQETKELFSIWDEDTNESLWQMQEEFRVNSKQISL